MPIFNVNKGYFLLFVALVICLISSQHQEIQGSCVMPHRSSHVLEKAHCKYSNFPNVKLCVF